MRWARPRRRGPESRRQSLARHQGLCGLRPVTLLPGPASRTVKWKEWSKIISEILSSSHIPSINSGHSSAKSMDGNSRFPASRECRGWLTPRGASALPATFNPKLNPLQAQLPTTPPRAVQAHEEQKPSVGWVHCRNEGWFSQPLPKEMCSRFQETELNDSAYLTSEVGGYSGDSSWTERIFITLLLTKGEKRLFPYFEYWLFLWIYLRVWYVFGGLKYFCYNGDMALGHHILTPDDSSCWLMRLTACPLTPHPFTSPRLLKELLAQKAGADLNNIAVEKLCSSKTKKAVTIFYLYFHYFDLKRYVWWRCCFSPPPNPSPVPGNGATGRLQAQLISRPRAGAGPGPRKSLSYSRC